MIQATAWSVIRSVLKDEFSFSQIKDITGEAGLPIFRIGGVVQAYTGGSSKGQLIDNIDKLYCECEPADQSKIVLNTIKIMIQKKPKLTTDIDQRLRSLGWFVNNGEIFPLKYHLDIETISMPQNILDSLEKSILRFRDGDISGSISSICASIDTLSEDVYKINSNLGNHLATSYHERVAKAFSMKEEAYKKHLEKVINDDNSLKRIWENHKKAVSCAAYILGEYRRNISDIHGERKDEIDPVFAKKALDCCVFIIKAFMSA